VTAGPSKSRRKASNKAYDDAAKRNPKISMAILAQGGSDWGPATGLWLQVYKSEGYKQTYLQNANTCSHKWVFLNLDPFRREALSKCIQTLIEITKTHGLFDRPEIKALLAQRLSEAAKSTYVAGFPKTAQNLVGEIAALGEDYATEASNLWKRLASD
jgi:tRNA A37 N6-isopentenylltransferase MiaA